MAIGVQARERYDDIVDAIAPLPRDIVIAKTKPSVFFGTPFLAMLVEAWQIEGEEEEDEGDAGAIAAEVNAERKVFYQLCWHLGASQGDIAALKGEDIDWENTTVSFFRKKTGVPVLVHLLTRPRPMRLPLSTLRFIREAVRERRARHRLRDLIILGLRTLAVLLAALAIALRANGEYDVFVCMRYWHPLSDAVVAELRKLGARIEPLPDGFVVEGPARLRGAAALIHTPAFAAPVVS
mgnify:CR=1 FL=1